MSDLVLYCKSYKTDLRRLVRLAESVRKFNTEKIPFYVSVPTEDLALFREHLYAHQVDLIADEDIIKSSPKLDLETIKKLPGNLSQQIVKSEFWRLGISDSYLCLDSDAMFIRPFGSSDYMDSSSTTPYTVISEAHDLMEMALSNNKRHVLSNFTADSASVKKLFNRCGKDYSFGPMPMAWSKHVWDCLDHKFLTPQNMTFADAISLAPLESRWYGEALLAYRPIPLLPSEAFFKVFHYAWQFDAYNKKDSDFNDLSNLYSGVILQSSWDREMDWPKQQKLTLSDTARRLRRFLRKI